MIFKPRAPQINWSSPLAKGLVSDTSFFERGGTNAMDLVKRTNGAITTATWIREGLLGPSLNFSATSKVQIASRNILSGLTDATIFALVNANAQGQPSSGGFIYCERNATAGNDIFNFGIGAGAGTNLIFKYRDDAGTLNNFNSISGIFSQAFWQAVAVVKRGTSISWYVNGVLKDTATLTATNTFTDSLVCLIGNDPRDGNSSLVARLGAVRLYKAALPPSAQKQMYIDPWSIYSRVTAPSLNNLRR